MFTPLTGTGSVTLTNFNEQPLKPVYMPIYIQHHDGKEEIAQKDKAVLHQLKTDHQTPRIQVNVKPDKLILTSAKDGIPLYGPENLKENIEGKCGDLALGTFPICENDQGELLFIKKTRGAFWYVPGGLVEVGENLWQSAVRELNEETNINLNQNIPGEMLFAYESVTPTRHNMMVFFYAPYNGSETLTVTPDDEISERAWIKPATFWSSYLKKEIKSLPSIQLTFQYYLETKLSSLTVTEKSELDEVKNNNESLDKMLFDLSFFELKNSNPGFEFSLLLGDAKTMTENLQK